MHSYIHTYIHAYIHTYICTYVCVHIYICMCIHAYIHLVIFTFIHVYIDTYIHTNPNTDVTSPVCLSVLSDTDDRLMCRVLHQCVPHLVHQVDVVSIAVVPPETDDVDSPTSIFSLSIFSSIFSLFTLVSIFGFYSDGQLYYLYCHLHPKN